MASLGHENLIPMARLQGILKIASGHARGRFHKGIGRSLAMGVVIVVIAIAGMAAIFVAGNSAVSGPPGSSGQTSSTSGSLTTSVTGCSDCTGPAPQGFGLSVLQQHIAHINARDPLASASDYTSNGVMIWSGNTEGLGGTYTPQSNIRFTYETAIGGATALAYTISNFTAKGSPTNPNIAEATAVFNFTGNSHVLGEFNGTIDSTLDYVNQGGQWLISQESSNYVVFHSQYTQGATTFPQWQLTGPSLPQRYSESPFKNWVYFYGGAAAAIAVACYLASLPLVIYLRKKRTSRRASEGTTQ